MCWLLLLVFFTVLLNGEFPKVQRKMREIEFTAGKKGLLGVEISQGIRSQKIGIKKREKMKYSNN